MFKKLFSSLAEFIFTTLEEQASGVVKKTEKLIRERAQAIIKDFIKLLALLFATVLGLGLVFAGVLVFFTRYFAIDIVLVAAGLLLIYTSFLLYLIFK
ncbi:MAG: hypothetical protein ACMXYF_03870 [Candidatus Woesearchaeota archaeon]